MPSAAATLERADPGPGARCEDREARAARGGRRRSSPPPPPRRGGDLLLRLRGEGAGRAPVDPYLAGGLRAWLEDAAALVADGTGAPGLAGGPGGGIAAVGGGREMPGRSLIVGMPDVAAATCDAARQSSRSGGEQAGFAVARLALARTSFRLALAGAGLVRGDPFGEALSALRSAGGVPRLIATMSDADTAALRAAVAHDAAGIAADWRPPPPSWLPRTAERLCAPLAAGAVLLRATADLALGSPPQSTASVCLVSLRVGRPGEGDISARRFLALLETLRSGAPPFRVATYHPGQRELVCEDVTDSMLAAAVHDVLERLSSPDAAPGEQRGTR